MLMDVSMLTATLSPDVAFWLIAVWLFAVGGAIGSFLNVVVYRLPAGISLVTPGSHCPVCKHPIRWFDNVPIFGWVVLAGRCRDCRTPISVRYPIVEAITAALFFLLGVVQCLGDGVNLPLRAVELRDATILPRTSPELFAIYAYQMLLLCTLLAAALIEYDGHRPPVRLFLPALIGGAVAPLIWPGLRPVPAGGTSAGAVLAGGMAGFTDGVAGVAAGAILGLLALRIFGVKQRPTTVFGPACVGLFLGWQAAVAITGVMAVIHLPLSASGRWISGIRRLPPATWLALATVGWILGWASWVGRFPVLGWGAPLARFVE